MSMFLLCSCFEIFFFFFCQHLQQKRHLRVLSGKSRTLQDSGNAAVWQRFMPHFGILCNKTKLSLWVALKVLFVLFKSNLASIIIIACLHVWGKYLHQVCKIQLQEAIIKTGRFIFLLTTPPLNKQWFMFDLHIFLKVFVFGDDDDGNGYNVDERWWWIWWIHLFPHWVMMNIHDLIAWL